MKVQTIFLNLIQGVKNALQESKDYTDNATAELTDSGWLSAGNLIRYRKKNGVVYITGRSAGDQSLPASTYVTLATLPSEYRPTESIRIGSDASGDGAIGITALVSTEGYIRIWSSAKNSYWNIFGSFPVGG